MSYFIELIQDILFSQTPKKQTKKFSYPKEFYDPLYGLTNKVDNPRYNTFPNFPVDIEGVNKINQQIPNHFVHKPEFQQAYMERKMRAAMYQDRIGQIDPYAHNVIAAKRKVDLNGNIKDSKIGRRYTMNDTWFDSVQAIYNY